jgi:hypothetical protein
MRKTMLLVGLIGLGLGCTARDRAEWHDKSARKDVASARKELNEGEQKAGYELAEARKEADEDLQNARDERRKAAEARADDRDHDRQPVAGRDERPPMTPELRGKLENDLRDKLGVGWTVERRLGSFVATRKEPVIKSGPEFRKHVDDQSNTILKDNHDARVRYEAGELRLDGRFDECANAAKAVDRFADIDGINQITLDASCTR